MIESEDLIESAHVYISKVSKKYYGCSEEHPLFDSSLCSPGAWTVSWTGSFQDILLTVGYSPVTCIVFQMCNLCPQEKRWQRKREREREDSLICGVINPWGMCDCQDNRCPRHQITPEPPNFSFFGLISPHCSTHVYLLLAILVAHSVSLLLRYSLQVIGFCVYICRILLLLHLGSQLPIPASIRLDLVGVK